MYYKDILSEKIIKIFLTFKKRRNYCSLGIRPFNGNIKLEPDSTPLIFNFWTTISFVVSTALIGWRSSSPLADPRWSWYAVVTLWFTYIVEMTCGNVRCVWWCLKQRPWLHLLFSQRLKRKYRWKRPDRKGNERGLREEERMPWWLLC